MATLARDDNVLLLFEIDASLLVLLQLYSACDSRYRHTLTALPQVTVRVAQRAKFLTQRHSEEIITKEPFSSKRMSSKHVDVLFSSTTNFQWSGGGKSFDQDDDDEIEEEIIDDIEENCESDDIEEDCESDSEEEKSDHLYKFEKEKSEFENKAEKSKESEKSGDFWDAPRKEAGDSSAHDHFEEEFKEESEGAAGFQEDPVSVDNSEMGYEYDFGEVCLYVCVSACAHISLCVSWLGLGGRESITSIRCPHKI